MAAFLRLSIRGCLPKSRATHSPRDVIILGLFLSCGTEVAPRRPGAGTRNMPFITAAEVSIYLLFPAHPTGYPPDLDVGPLLLRETLNFCSGSAKFELEDVGINIIKFIFQ